MEINNANLKALFVAFNAAFKAGLGQAACGRGEGLRPGRRGVLHRVAGRWRAGACRRL